jgi:hypothetical protein
MRLLPPVDAARLWDTVADKIRAQCAWPWADQRTSWLLDEDGAVADPGHPARAAVVASHISALIHTRSDYNPAPDWREVTERADASPDPVIREWLQSRAIAGKVAAYQLRGVDLPSDDLAAFWELVDHFPAVAARLPVHLAAQLVASCCAALEALVEVAEMRSDPSLVSDIGLIERWLGRIEGQVPADMLALGTMIAARGQALHGRFWAALELAARAERSSAEMPTSRPGRWADFDAPAMTCHRIRLELIRMAAALPVADDPLRYTPLDAWQRSAEADLGTIDADRLLAAILLRRLSAGIVAHDEVARLAALEEAATERMRRSPRSALWCHLAVPPLFAAVAFGWCALGQSDRAIDLLRTRRRRALAASDTDAVNAALIATLEISRRMRIAQPVLAKNSAKSADSGEQAAAWALAALTEQPDVRAAPPVGELPDACLHDWWRSRPTPPQPGSEDARLFRRRAGQLASSRGSLTPFGAVSLGLDLAEAEIAGAKPPAWLPIDIDGLERSAQCTAEQLVRVTLRMLALGHPGSPGADGSAADRTRQVDRWEGVGRRRRAELAMDEGELLALRLPRQAIPLLDLAASWFGEADDPAGALFATTAATLARQRAEVRVPPESGHAFSTAYEAIRGRAGAPLPTWADLTGWFSERPPRQLEKPADAVLGGWLSRLVACLARGGAGADGATHKPVSPTQLKTMLETTLGSVPAELNVSVPARRRRARPLARIMRRVLRIIVRILVVLVVVVFGYQAVVSAVFTFTDSAQPGGSSYVVSDVFVAITATLIAATAVILGTRLRRRLPARARAWWWAKAQVWLRIAPAPGAGAPDGDIKVAIDKWQTERFDPRGWTRHQDHMAKIAILPPLRAYQLGAAAMPGSLQDDLRKLASRLGPRSLRVPLDVDPALERLPWEALLSRPILAGDVALPGALDFWRRGEPLAGTGLPRRPRPPRCVDVLADSTRRLFAERAALARAMRFPNLSADGADVNRAVERAGSRAAEPSDIVLVIGRPVRVRGAVLLHTAEQAAARGTSADDLRDAVLGGGLLEPEVVAGLQARLVIVLGAPTEISGRFDTERRDAADLRGWAADVFRAGAETVVSLPSLQAKLAEAVLAAMASRISTGITPHTVHNAVRAARTQIGTWAQSARPAGGPREGGGASAERSAEQALDVCLFRRDLAPSFPVREEQT